MAKRIKAINALRARFKRQRPITEDELAEDIAQKSNLSRGDVYHALLELSHAIDLYLQLGHGVRLKGLGLITPSMNTKGELTIRILPDAKLLQRINDPRYQGLKIINAQNLGKTGDELVAQWNALHPDDTVDD